MEIVHHALRGHRDLAHVRPRVPLRWVEVDQEVVRFVDVADPRVPGMQLDAGEVGEPRQPGRVVDHRKVDLVSGRVVDVHRLEPLRMRIGHALLVEEIGVDAVRVALHLHRSLAHVRQDGRGDVDVVADEISLRDPRSGKQDLVLVGDGDLAIVDEHEMTIVAGCWRAFSCTGCSAASSNLASPSPRVVRGYRTRGCCRSTASRHSRFRRSAASHEGDRCSLAASSMPPQ